jgi:hypothetical protein
MAYDADDPTGLVGEELNTVAFVMDYWATPQSRDAGWPARGGQR